MSDPLLIVSGVSKRFGGFTALDQVDLAVHPGERLGLIGPNGSGKSTLVNCIAGTLANDEGSIRFDGSLMDREAPHQRVRRGIARTFQIPKPFASMSVLENLCIPLEYAARKHASLIRSQIRDEALQIRECVREDEARIDARVEERVVRPRYRRRPVIAARDVQVEVVIEVE